MNISAPNVATTTLYRKGQLPKRKVLAKYRMWGTDIICATGNIDDREKDINTYGIIKTTFDVLEQKEYLIETQIEGNAVWIEDL